MNQCKKVLRYLTLFCTKLLKAGGYLTLTTQADLHWPHFQVPNSHVWLTASERIGQGSPGPGGLGYGDSTFISREEKTRQAAPRYGRFRGFGEGLRDSFLETFQSEWAYSTSWQVKGYFNGGGWFPGLYFRNPCLRTLTCVCHPRDSVR